MAQNFEQLREHIISGHITTIKYEFGIEDYINQIINVLLQEEHQVNTLDLSGLDLNDATFSFPKFLWLISKTNVIKELKLGHEEITKNNIKDICYILKHNLTFESLSLNSSELKNKHIRIISKLLIECNIKFLSLSRNIFGIKGYSTLSEAIKYNKNIHTLFLGWNNIGNDDKLQILCESLTENTSITYLHLNHNQINDTGLKIISDMLKVNNSLKKICLDGNQFSCESIKYLSSVLRSKPKQIKWLGLNSCSLNDDSMFELFNVIKKTYITRLYIGYNVYIKSIDKLFDLLKIHNDCLKLLDVRGIEINAKYISEMLPTQKCLKYFLMNGYHFTQDSWSVFKEGLNLNSSIEFMTNPHCQDKISVLHTMNKKYLERNVYNNKMKSLSLNKMLVECL